MRKRVSKRWNTILRNRKTFITIKIIRLKYDRISITFFIKNKKDSFHLTKHFVTRTIFIFFTHFIVVNSISNNNKMKKWSEMYFHFFTTHILCVHSRSIVHIHLDYYFFDINKKCMVYNWLWLCLLQLGEILLMLLIKFIPIMRFVNFFRKDVFLPSNKSKL